MLTARIICVAVILVMAAHFATAIAASGIHTGLGTDVFFAGYAASPWQAGINVDLMTGLLMACAWILWRERSVVGGLVWVIAVFYWGNLVVALYVLRALHFSGGRWDCALLGYHASNWSEPAMRPWPFAIKLILWALAAAILVYALRATVAADFAFAPTMGYMNGLGCLAWALLRIAYVGRRAQ